MTARLRTAVPCPRSPNGGSATAHGPRQGTTRARRPAARGPRATSAPARSADPTARPGPTRCAGSRRRSAAGATSPDCSRTSSTRPSALFGVDRAGLWLYDPQRRRRPLTPRRPPRPVGRDHRGDRAPCRPTRRRPGWTPSDAGRSASWTAPCARPRRALRGRLSRDRRPQRLLRAPRLRRRAARPARALPPRGVYAWTPDERALARAFGDQMATAIGSARLADSAPHARRPPDLDRRARRPAQPAAGRPRPSPGPSSPRRKRLIDHDTIRVYRVDHDDRACASRSRSRARSSATRPDRSRACASRSARASPAGSPSTAAPCASATPRDDPRGLDRRRHRPARVDADRADAPRGRRPRR